MALQGKDCLLVLDDAWSLDMSESFVFLDATTRSRALISSRLRSTLAGCEVIDIGLPTEDEAVEILFAAANVLKSPSVPFEAKEVARLCKFLPLTLGIAGRMARDLSLQSSWVDVLLMMKEELSTGGNARSAEDAVVSTSINSIQGSNSGSVARLLRAMALVPEDVRAPLDVLQWIFEADGDESSAKPSLLHLRRWVGVLIDRSLVLGPIDQPSLHGPAPPGAVKRP
jgi:hypothetical protein